jgi:hypothetical protein
MADRDLANKPPDYQRDLAHLLPAEITAFYIGTKAIIPPSFSFLTIVFGFPVVVAIIFYFIMPAMMTIRNSTQRILYCLTFLVWVLAIQMDQLMDLVRQLGWTYQTEPVRVVVSLFVAVWSFMLPFAFRRINQDTSSPSSSAVRSEAP